MTCLKCKGRGHVALTTETNFEEKIYSSFDSQFVVFDYLPDEGTETCKECQGTGKIAENEKLAA